MNEPVCNKFKVTKIKNYLKVYKAVRRSGWKKNISIKFVGCFFVQNRGGNDCLDKVLGEIW